MRSKMIGIKLKQGERVRLETPGGGGYGAPAARKVTARESDAAMGYVVDDSAAAVKGAAA